MAESASPHPGVHNVYNALATVCVGLELELSFEKIQTGLQGYEGVQRRMQQKGEIGGITIVDDYGHHPTEIRATLEAIKQAWPKKRLVVLFQPHRYSRTKALFKEFQTCFHKADYLVMSDIYAASEEPLPGVTGESLLAATKIHGQRHTQYIGEVDKMAEEIMPELQQGDLVLTLGAGNIVRVGEELLQLLQKKTQRTYKRMNRAQQNRLSELVSQPVKWQCRLDRYTSLAIGGPAEAVLTVNKRQEIQPLLVFLTEENIPWRIIGRGTNLLIKDEGFAGVILVLGDEFKTVERQQEKDGETVIVRAGAGFGLAQLTFRFVEWGLTGLEFGCGIPGTLGGAVIMNAGAWGSEMSSIVESVKAYDSRRRGEYCIAENSIFPTDVGKILLRIKGKPWSRKWRWN